MDQNKLVVYSFKYEWVIEINRFRNIWYQDEVNEIESPLFPSDSGQQWIVRLFRSEDYCGIFLEIIPNPPEFVWGKFSFSWNNIQIGCIYHNESDTSSSNELSMDPIYDTIMAHNASNVKIVCKASVVLESDIDVSLVTQTNKSLLKMGEDLESLYESKQHSDITFCVQDKEIKAHRAVLIARSEVFAAMFENQLEECQSGKISITDIDDEVIEEMLRYMYSGTVPKLDTMNVELLECAEKYQMADLKENCLKSLKIQITIENAANTLMLADKYRSEELKRHAIKYIIENAEDVTETQAWKDMVTTHGQLTDEIRQTIAVAQLNFAHITIENAANTLMLADKYRSEELKRHAIKYIIENAEDVTETQAWKDMITTHGHLIEETFRTIAVGSAAKKKKNKLNCTLN